ncbi:MAG: asparagine synthetase B, partial [Candidatus Electrothrix sp. AR4]|nr:asparagine synthetase B [Candidatus Electrothrix sp. AR4]
MCGIAGFFIEHAPEEMNAVAARMASALAHRGPDDAGVWLDKSVGVALAHRRLSVIDLSPTGHQPMHSVSGRYVIVFNGEIYNHLVLRKQLTASNLLRSEWKGESDTETLLACFEAWDIEATLKRSVGMFAFA